MRTRSGRIEWTDSTAELRRNILQGIASINAMREAIDRAAARLQRDEDARRLRAKDRT